MSYKKIETMRQVRLMITDVIVPAAVVIYMIDSKNPELKYKIVNGAKSWFRKTKARIKRGKYIEKDILTEVH